MSKYAKALTYEDIEAAAAKHGDETIIFKFDERKEFGSEKKRVNYVPMKMKLADGEIVPIRIEAKCLINITGASTMEKDDGSLKNKATLNFAKLTLEKLLEKIPPKKISLTPDEKAAIKDMSASKMKDYFKKIELVSGKIDDYVEKIIAARPDGVEELMEKWDNKQKEKDDKHKSKLKAFVKSTNSFLKTQKLLCELVSNSLRSLEKKQKEKAIKLPLALNAKGTGEAEIFIWKKDGYTKTDGEYIKYDDPRYKMQIQANSSGDFIMSFTTKSGKAVNNPIILNTNGDEAKVTKVVDKKETQESININTIGNYITPFSRITSAIFQVTSLTVSKVGLSFNPQFNKIMIKRNERQFDGSAEQTKKMVQEASQLNDSDDETEAKVIYMPTVKKSKDKDKDKEKDGKKKNSSRVGKAVTLIGDSDDEGDKKKAKPKKKGNGDESDTEKNKKKNKGKADESGDEQEKPAVKGKKAKPTAEDDASGDEQEKPTTKGKKAKPTAEDDASGDEQEKPPVKNKKVSSDVESD